VVGQRFGKSLKNGHAWILKTAFKPTDISSINLSMNRQGFLRKSPRDWAIRDRWAPPWISRNWRPRTRFSERVMRGRMIHWESAATHPELLSMVNDPLSGAT